MVMWIVSNLLQNYDFPCKNAFDIVSQSYKSVSLLNKYQKLKVKKWEIEGEKRDREFVEEGSVRKRMTAARLDMRDTQKQIITQQEQEIAALKARIASLEREIAVLRGETRDSRDSP